VDSLVDGSIASDGDSVRVFREIYDSLLTGDWRKPDYYFNLYDFEDYIRAKLRAIYDTRDEREFARKCLMNTVNAGKFSSDRTIKEYASEIWHIERIQSENR
jgi:starch phosphorylase